MTPADRAARRALVADPPVAVCPRCGEFFGWIPDDPFLCKVCRMVDCVLAGATAFRVLAELAESENDRYREPKEGEQYPSFP